MNLDLSEIWDQEVTTVSIGKLNDVIKEKVVTFIMMAQKERIFLRIPTNGGYISFVDQNLSFSRGDTEIQGGETYHNFGLAFDLLPLKSISETLPPREVDGKRTLSNEKWEKVGAIGKSLGFEWGGEWRINENLHPKFDSAHFQFPRDIINLEDLGELRDDQKRDLVVLPDEMIEKFNSQ